MGFFGVPIGFAIKIHSAPARILNNFVASMVGVLLFQVQEALRGFRGPERRLMDPELGNHPVLWLKKIKKNGGFIEININYVHINILYLTL